MTDEEKTDPESVDADVDTDHDEIAGVLAVRRTVQSTAGELIGREFDAVSEITPTDDGWRAIVEVVERRAVPDTQDIVGRYEIELDENATVHGYRRLDRYRRGDTAQFE
uniref:Gas vesicle protein n=2 Tax=Haloterrigena alkaliphila TaxID=2816475 RepID=A0A8A2VLF5_9EURY